MALWYAFFTRQPEQRLDLTSLFVTQFDESAERGYAKLSFDEAAADMALIVVAATDTGVQTVLAFLRYIATDAHRRDILQQELKDVSLQLKETAEMDVPSLLGLPYLDACIQECLRILPPGPFGKLIATLYLVLSLNYPVNQDRREPLGLTVCKF